MVDITWFGGEPLLNTEIIGYICKELSDSGIKFSSSVISNGLLFHKGLIHMAKDEWKLKHVQISLDGTEEEYNKIKNYKTVCENPFRKVMDNIKRLLKNEVNVSVRLNISKSNAGNIRTLVEYISDEIAFNKYLVIYPAFVEGLGKEHSLNDKEKVDIIRTLFDVLPFYSFVWHRTRLYEMPSLYACMRENPSSVVIDADGSICRCEHDIGRKKQKYVRGSIRDDKGNTVERFCDIEVDYGMDGQCRRCKYYPRCLGGCMADRLDGNGYCSIDRYIIEAVIEDWG